LLVTTRRANGFEAIAADGDRRNGIVIVTVHFEHSGEQRFVSIYFAVRLKVSR